ncbi:WD40 repeat domain-containing protein [Streptomyces sp. NPDC127117]|uniref:WD40 repeat domain-containing protein n=1 Tax=Streptomyces sp. NPDC127117 TaxID=3345368 RepID=UPI00363FE7A5
MRLRDTTTGKTTGPEIDHLGELTSVAFGPDGHTLAMAGSGGFVRLWDTTTGKTTTAPAGGQRSFAPMAFSPDGHTLATTAYGDGYVATVVRLWFYIAPDTAISRICAAVAREIEESERDRYPTVSSKPVCRS